MLIHNYRMELVGFNQIKAVFDPEYVRIKSLEGYDHILQYYFKPDDYNSDEDNEDSNTNDSTTP